MLTYTLIAGGIIALVLVVGAVITFSLYQRYRPNLRLPITSGTAMSVLGVTLIVVAFLHRPDPCLQSVVSFSKGKPVCVTGNLTIDGSTALQPFVHDVAAQYMQQCPGASIVVNGSNSEAGLRKLEDNSIDIADSDVLASSDTPDLQDHKVVVAVFVVLVNAQVGVVNLSADELQKIYDGTVTNWKAINGKDMPIVAYRRADGSGTRLSFDNYVLPEKRDRIQSPKPVNNPADVIKDVMTTPGAIGYVSYFDAIKYSAESLIVGIDGTRPTQDLYTIVPDNTYKFWSVEHMYTKDTANNLAKAFIDYMGNDQVHNIITSDLFVSINQMQSDALAQHCTL